MKTPTSEPIAPKDCTNEDLLTIERDNIDFGEYWILVDGYRVSIHQQASGESSKQQISIPIKTFNKLIEWYCKPQPRIKQP